MYQLLRRRVVRATLYCGLLAIGVLVLAGAAGVWSGRLNFQPVLNGSMRPKVQPGDLAVTQRISVSSLKVGDVIVFYPPGTTRATMHRIAKINRAGAVSTAETVTTVTTYGDANNHRIDPWGPVTLRGDSVYRLRTTVPYLGWVSEWRFLGPLFLIAAGLLLALTAFTSLSQAGSLGLGRRRATVLHHQHGKTKEHHNAYGE